jgi:hypothetical protein
MATSLTTITPQIEQQAINDVPAVKEVGEDREGVASPGIEAGDFSTRGIDKVPSEQGGGLAIQEDISQAVERDGDTEYLEEVSPTPVQSGIVLPVDSDTPTPNDDDAITTTSNAHGDARPATPISRTSTPPLPAGTTAPVKKFSSVNVNRQFLKKTVGPAVGTPAGATKINSLTGEPFHKCGVTC